MFRTSPSLTTYVLPSRPCLPTFATSACGAELDEVVPVDHLAADEAARDVGVDRARGVERGLAVAQRPRPRVLLAGGEERDQVERLREAAGDVLERRLAAVAERRRLLVRAARPAPPRAGGRSRRGRSRSRSAASSSAARARRAARPDSPPALCPRRRARAPSAAPRASARSFASPDFACFSTRSRRRSTWSRSATSSSSLNVSRSSSGVGATPKPRRTTSSASTCRRFPSCAAPEPGTSWTRIVAGVIFRAFTTSASCRSRVVGDRRHADVRLAVLAAARLRQRGEERRLAAAGRADDPDLECHRPWRVARPRSRAARAASAARRARGAGAT